MRKQRWAVALAALACAGAEAQGAAGEALPPIPEKDPQELFQDVPAPWRDYFLQAREAERIDDPLQRCLAYPDLPGNSWQAGHAAAHCRYHANRPIPLAEIDGYLDRGEAAALDARLDALLAKHFLPDGDGEDIHVALEAFSGGSEEADRVSARWHALAPDSPWALVARGNHYRAAAWDARGGKWASETPRENLRRMTDLAEQAVPLLRESIRLQPRMMPAYAGLLNVAMLDSRPKLEREALAGAQAQDPACIEIARLRMNALQPRWGGSYAEMLTYASELSRHLARRPQLAIHVAAPYGDRGDRLIAEKEFTRETADVLDIAVRIGSNEGHLRDAADVVLNLRQEDGGPDRWKGVALLLQEHRFNDTNAWAHRQIAWQLVRAEPEWGLRHALRAVELDPDDGLGQVLAGAGYYGTHQPEQAERHYLLAAEDPEHRRSALLSLGTLWMYDAGLEGTEAATRSKPYVDRLLALYPADGRGLLLRLSVQSQLQGYIDDEVIRTFLKHADPDDPLQANAAAEIRKSLDGGAAQPPESP